MRLRAAILLLCIVIGTATVGTVRTTAAVPAPASVITSLDELIKSMPALGPSQEVGDLMMRK
jgi:hypothetical protein